MYCELNSDHSIQRYCCGTSIVDIYEKAKTVFGLFFKVDHNEQTSRLKLIRFFVLNCSGQWTCLK